MNSYLLIASEAGTTFGIIIIVFLAILFFLWISGALEKIKEAIEFAIYKAEQKEKDKDEKEKIALEKAKKEKKKAQIKTWLSEGYHFHNLNTKQLCKNLINKLGEEKFYESDMIILQTVLLLYPNLQILYPDFKAIRYYIAEKTIIQTFVSTIMEKEGISETEENLIRCYSTIKNTILSILSSHIKEEFELSGGDTISEYLSNKCIVQDDSTNIFKLSIYIKVNGKNDSSVMELFNQLKEKIQERIELSEKNKIKEELLNGQSNENTVQMTTNLDDIDFMTGVEFEKFLGEKFKSFGDKVEYTKASGDQGIDLIITKNSRKTGVQAKCYSQKVSNGAIQEAVAGKAYYNLDRVIVITNNYFTPSAKELAASNNVILWDRDVLKEKFFNE